MIRNFADKETEKVFNRERSTKFHPDIQRLANTKLRILDAAGSPEDMKVPPGNRLKKLKGKRSGQYSIRINDQWRICFRWETDGPHDVKITDYP